MDTVIRYAPTVGRILLSLIFLVAGVMKVLAPAGAIAMAREAGLPMADFGVWAGAIIEIIAGAMLLVGWRVREAGLALFLYLIPVSLVMHRPTDPAQQTQFLKNLAIMGGLLALARTGAGPLSVDEKAPRLSVRWQRERAKV